LPAKRQWDAPLHELISASLKVEEGVAVEQDGKNGPIQTPSRLHIVYHPLLTREMKIVITGLVVHSICIHDVHPEIQVPLVYWDHPSSKHSKIPPTSKSSG